MFRRYMRDLSSFSGTGFSRKKSAYSSSIMNIFIRYLLYCEKKSKTGLINLP